MVSTESPRSIYETPLAAQSVEEGWNSILWRLGVATGQIAEGSGFVEIDPDEILKSAEDLIFRYRNLEY